MRRAGDPFTPNDCRLDGGGRRPAARLSIVTGPNMAGKSTFLRQNALLAILAQAGSFVPARSLQLGVVDRLFSRVGAGDDLARGRSTFMAEMVETAAILTQATPRSFVILDEIGRGTATYDGLAIAWACAEALHDVNRCRALFATHYHELATLEERLAHVSNLSLRAKEWNGDLVFLHEAGPGPADRSYGVQVAKLAGVPPAVVARARQVLDRLESEAVAHADLAELPLFAAAAPAAPAFAGPSRGRGGPGRARPRRHEPARGDGRALPAERARGSVTTLILVRHAQSAPDPALPERDWPLSELGRRQAADLAPVLQALGVDALASSPYIRGDRHPASLRRRRRPLDCRRRRPARAGAGRLAS